MADLSNEIKKLDFSKPPPGYEVSEWTGRPEICAPGWYYYPDPTENAANLGAPKYAEDEARDDAWNHYKLHNDPPCTAYCPSYYSDRGLDWFGGKEGARAALWSWYERCLALYERLAMTTMPSTAGVRTSLWPRMLGWSEPWYEAVVRWLDEGGDPPEVLRG